MQGYIKLHRQILSNPVVLKDSEYFAIWIYLLLQATHTEIDMMFGGKRTTLHAGQLITGRKSIADKLHISESKVQRVLKTLEIEQQIEQQTSTKNRLITLKNWCRYQIGEQQIEQQVNNNRTTSEQQVNTNKNVKNDKNVKNERSTAFKPPAIDEVKLYCKERSNNIDAEQFVDFYSAKGWMVGKNKMKDWKACMRTWEKRKSGDSIGVNKRSTKNYDHLTFDPFSEYTPKDPRRKKEV